MICICGCGNYPFCKGLPAKEVDGFYLQIITRNTPEYGKYIQSISTQELDDMFTYGSFALVFEFTSNTREAAFIEKEQFGTKYIQYIQYIRAELRQKGLQFQTIPAKGSK